MSNQPNVMTHKAVQQIGAEVAFIKVKAVGSLELTSTAATRDAVVVALSARGTNPLIVSDGYTIGTDSYLIIAMKKGAWTAADAQTAVRATTPASLDTAVVAITDQLTGAAI